MTRADLTHHGLTLGMPVVVTAGAKTEKRRAKGCRQVQGTVYAINSCMFTLDTPRGFESFLLADLQLTGPDRITVEVLKC